MKIKNCVENCCTFSDLNNPGNIVSFLKELLAWIGKNKGINEATLDVWKNARCFKYGKEEYVFSTEFDTSAEAEEYIENIDKLEQVAVSYSVKEGKFRYTRAKAGRFRFARPFVAIDLGSACGSTFVFISVSRKYAEKLWMKSVADLMTCR